MMVMMSASGTLLSRCHCRSSAWLMCGSRDRDAQRGKPDRAGDCHGEELDRSELERGPGGRACGHQGTRRLQCFHNLGKLLERREHVRVRLWGSIPAGVLQT